MKPNQKLIDALRRTAELVEYAELFEVYDWYHTSQCNCGLLARELLNCTANELTEMLIEGHIEGELKNRDSIRFDSEQQLIASWGYLSETCPDTGLPYNKIVQTLFEYGLEQEDFNDIEGAFRKKGAIQLDAANSPKNRKASADWMREKADKLEARLKAVQQPQVTTQAKKISVRQRAF